MQKITLFLLSSLLVVSSLWVGVSAKENLSYFFNDKKRAIASSKTKTIHSQMWEVLDLKTTGQTRVVQERFKLKKGQFITGLYLKEFFNYLRNFLKARLFSFSLFGMSDT